MIASKTNGFSHHLWRWFERMGFKEDPFSLTQAEKEGDNLLSFYVDRPYLYDILGDPAHPQTAFLMAKQGYGKTASKEIVTYQCKSGKLRRRALAVHYSDFSHLLSQVQGDVTKITAWHHVENIIRCILKSLIHEVPATYFNLLEEIERSLLVSYAQTFADPISQLKLKTILSDDPAKFDWQELTLVEILTTLAQIFVHLGQKPECTYQSLYILVDCVDETSAGPKAATALLESLISEKGVLDVPYIAFKFFLPLEVGQQLDRIVGLRSDRRPVLTIDWDKAALQDVIRQRLIHYSNGKRESLGDLCTTNTKSRITDRLIGASGNSPRTLLRLCQELIRTHVTRTRDALIDKTDVAAALANFSHRAEMTDNPTASISCTAEAGMDELPAVSFSVTPTETGIHLDDSGHVWVDGKRLSPALTQQEFHLLRALYVRSPNIMTHEELIDIIWPESEWESGEIHDEQNLRKLVSRVRKRLEPEVSSGRSQFLRSVRGRGYWLNISGASDSREKSN